MTHLQLTPASPDGSLAVTLPLQVELSVAAPSTLRALEVCVPPAMTHLDLSELPGGVMLHLHGGPDLRWLALPPGSGAHLHLSLAGAPALHIVGPLSWLDACWTTPAGPATLTARWNEEGLAVRPPRLRGAWLGPIAQAPADVELLAVCGSTDTVLELGGHGARVMVVQEARALRELRVSSPALLCVIDAPQLRSITGERPQGITCARAPRLQTVRGSGVFLGLRDSARVEQLAVEGSWAQLAIHRDGPRRVSAPGVRALEAVDVSRLGEVALAPAAEAPRLEPKIRAQLMLVALTEGGVLSPSERGRLVSDLVGGPEWSALERLLGALHAGAAPAEIWPLRMGLARRVRKNWPSGLDEGPWHWPATDQSARAWQADIALWLACRDHVASARGFGTQVRQSSAPDHLAAVVVAAVEQPHLLPIFVEQLRHGMTRPHFRRVRSRRRWGRAPTEAERAEQDTTEDPVVVDALKQVLRALVQLRHHPLAPRATQDLCTWTARRLTDASGVAVLSLLHALGCEAASGALATLAAEPHVPDAIRHRALMVQLSPPRSTHLRFSGASP